MQRVHAVVRVELIDMIDDSDDPMSSVESECVVAVYANRTKAKDRRDLCEEAAKRVAAAFTKWRKAFPPDPKNSPIRNDYELERDAAYEVMCPTHANEDLYLATDHAHLVEYIVKGYTVE